MNEKEMKEKLAELIKAIGSLETSIQTIYNPYGRDSYFCSIYQIDGDDEEDARHTFMKIQSLTEELKEFLP